MPIEHIGYEHVRTKPEIPVAGAISSKEFACTRQLVTCSATGWLLESSSTTSWSGDD